MQYKMKDGSQPYKRWTEKDVEKDHVSMADLTEAKEFYYPVVQWGPEENQLGIFQDTDDLDYAKKVCRDQYDNHENEAYVVFRDLWDTGDHTKVDTDIWNY